MNPTLPGGPSLANSAGLPEDVLIVEDDLLIAFDVQETLHELGVQSVRTATSVARALAMIGDRAPDFAMLDVGLIREKSFAVAEQLEELKIPFVFVTGYVNDPAFPARFARRPIINKPYVRDTLAAVLKNWRAEQR
jgi:CheY-like chemotaxis protein